MNPYETTQPTPKKEVNKIWSMAKKALGFLVVIIFFTGCFKIQVPAPITETTTFAEMSKVSLFHGIFVWPIGRILIWVQQITKNTFFTIFVVTMINRGIGSIVTLKSTIESEKMKEIQPELNAINTRYAGKKDQASLMQKNAELNRVFQKHDVNPMQSMGALFISLPLFMSIYVAIKNNVYLGETTIFGIKTSTVTSQAVKVGGVNYKIIIVMIALVALQWLSMKLPTYLNKQHLKRANPQAGQMQQNMEIILPIMMIAISWQVSIALLLYFTFSPLFTMVQSYLIHKYVVEKKEKEKAEVNKLY